VAIVTSRTRSSPGTGPRVALAVAVILAPGGAACDRSGASSTEQPAPSASVVSIGVTLGTCSDLSQCESECDAGSADRCRRLAATYALGEGVDKDETRATALYEHACDLKDPPACVFAGQMHEYAHGVPKDDAKAARLYETACTAGWAAGCYNLAIMFENGRGVARDPGKAAALYQGACAAGAKTACDRARDLQASAADAAEAR
jgi:TPR repeat protein